LRAMKPPLLVGASLVANRGILGALQNRFVTRFVASALENTNAFSKLLMDIGQRG
jgi:hypothetical protein